MARDKDKMHRLFYETIKRKLSKETIDFVTSEATREGISPHEMMNKMRAEYRGSKEFKKDFHRWNKDRLLKERGPRTKSR